MSKIKVRLGNNQTVIFLTHEQPPRHTPSYFVVPLDAVIDLLSDLRDVYARRRRDVEVR